MKTITSINTLQTLRKTYHQSIGFVATMGCLHKGHASLLTRSIAENDITILSIFINPTQFNKSSDFDNYPKTIAADLALAEAFGIDSVFIPDPKEMYPNNYHFHMTTTDPLAAVCEGKFRPGHYEGVLSVVLKLFNLIKPTNAYFGEKDYQQYVLIKRMVESFFIDVNVVMCATIRESSGLAFSSRNTKFNAEQKRRAEFFAKTLRENTDIDTIKKILIENNIDVDYVAHYQDRLLAAVTIDDVRLVDNILL